MCWVQVIDTDSHGAEERTLETWTVTPLGSDPSSTIYHLHNFGKSPKFLMPQFPHLDNKDKSVFPVN